jgi:hypothetical protein
MPNIYPYHIKPVREGFYKVERIVTGRDFAFSYWDGKNWSWTSEYIKFVNMLPSSHQNRRWYGLTEEEYKVALKEFENAR